MLEELVVREIARREQEKFLAAEHAHYCVSSVDPNVSGERRKNAVDRLLGLGKSIFPWIEWGAGFDREVAKRMSEQWKSTWGDPDDPAVKAQIDSVVRHLQKKSDAN